MAVGRGRGGLGLGLGPVTLSWTAPFSASWVIWPSLARTSSTTRWCDVYCPATRTASDSGRRGSVLYVGAAERAAVTRRGG
ncbi:hypothetical protein ACFU6S_18995 [Streptomyces sp. NPDC057456]|uniref:hypothetical protein n=1 Tax=Streptomyces sp. NPDC057456 TaxID=3346139 RepID=UPI0036741FA2